MTTYWINTVSADHVQRGVAGGFTQANHGKPHMLRKMARGDWIVFYSPKTALEHGESLQAFTAIGRVTDDEPYQDDPSGPSRRRMEFLPCTATPIRPLLDQLEFIVDPRHWGYKFRFGVFRIEERDFLLIRSAMTQPLAA
ncbi:EVE domain-containing protein [Mycolicibacterium vinylchloridicum]|uniref:EVE domain-containing protein n=1 Tax=Mycolicibacterium vinylchloridicum TaxID=2736928 RepID=UPI0015CA06C4|nr:EVE domain-containing protein [Mycolicibacterium vinylchloridicum]